MYGPCNNACAQADFVGAQPASCGAHGFSCAAGGTAPTDVTLQIGRSGYGGDAGFQLGAPYRLVLFGGADRLALRARLVAANGQVLYSGDFDSNSCDAAARRKLRARAAGASDAGAPGARVARRLEGLRMITWWTELRGSIDLINERRRFGADARWGGNQFPRVEPVVSHNVSCAWNAVGASTRVAVQRSAPDDDGAMAQCAGQIQPGSQAHNGGSGEAALSWDALRAELGDAFVLHADHFPLTLIVSDAWATVRGRGVAGTALQPSAPELYFSLYTEEFNYSTRNGLWFGLPLSLLFGSCCCCCLLRCLFPKPNDASLDITGSHEMRTRDSRKSEIADIDREAADPDMTT